MIYVRDIKCLLKKGKLKKTAQIKLKKLYRLPLGRLVKRAVAVSPHWLKLVIIIIIKISYYHYLLAIASLVGLQAIESWDF